MWVNPTHFAIYFYRMETACTYLLYLLKNVDWPELINLFKNLIIAGAAITGSIVAVKGLNTWRRQLRGQAEYELSKRIFKLTFQYRDALYKVRNFFMFMHEMPQPTKEQEERMSNEQIKYFGTYGAYKSRWDKVTEVRQSLYPELIEAEAILGSELQRLFEALFKLQERLFLNINYHLILIDPDTSDTMKEQINKKINDDIIYDTGEDDDFREEFSSSIKPIEQFLKPLLKH